MFVLFIRPRPLLVAHALCPTVQLPHRASTLFVSLSKTETWLLLSIFVGHSQAIALPKAAKTTGSHKQNLEAICTLFNLT